MSTIFISYRRQDTAVDMADRIYEHLARRWRGRVFMDIDSIAGGDLFDKRIQETLQNCAVVLVMIGRDWLSLRDEHGARRIDDPGDYPRMEVAAALKRGIRVIPVLTGNVALPTRAELPGDIAGLLDRQFVRVTRERFSTDVQRLMEAIAAEMPPERWHRVPWRAFAIATLVLGVATGAYVVLRQDRSTHYDSAAPVSNTAPAADRAATSLPDRTIETVPAAASGAATDGQANSAKDRPSPKSAERTLPQSDRPAPAIRAPSVKLDGLWASEFAQFSDDTRRREVLRLEIDGTAVFGESWQETWYPDATQPRLYRKFSFSHGTLQGDALSFCVPVTVVAAVVEKYRNCYTGKIGRDEITFRVAYNLDHPRYAEEHAKFVARRIGR